MSMAKQVNNVSAIRLMATSSARSGPTTLVSELQAAVKHDRGLSAANDPITVIACMGLVARLPVKSYH
jgi:hypothetical protein